MATRHENRNTGGFCDAVVRPVLDVRQQDDFALDRSQSSERFEEPSPEVSPLEGADRFWLVAGQRLVDGDESPATDGAKAVQGLPMDDRE